MTAVVQFFCWQTWPVEDIKAGNDQPLKLSKLWNKSPSSHRKSPFTWKDPKNRRYELRFAWKVFAQLVKAFRTLHYIGPCITVFGSARFKEDSVYYQQAMEFGKRIAASGFTTMTGGGPGIMEAANRGAYEAGGMSVGCNIQLPVRTGR
jgi:hypothetical protein